MAQATHTPGPWRKGFGRTTSEKYIDIYGVDNRTIAKLPVTDENRAEQEANAALIVNAADLLAAAKEVMETLEKHGGSIVPHLLDTDMNAGQRLRNAIAKSEAA